MGDSVNLRDEIRSLFRGTADAAPDHADYRLLEGLRQRSGGRVWFGLDSRGTRAVMFETTAEDGPVGSYSVSRVIQVSPRRILAAGGEETPVIRLLCDDPQMSDPFMTFVVDVLQKETEGAPIIRAIAQAAREWRELLSRAAGGLSGQEALGLYGELLFLERLVSDLGPGALGMWSGDSMGRHDFVGSNGSVEVKSTRRQDQASVSVHGLTQLLPPEKGFLVLAVAEIDESGGGEAIGQITERLESLGCASVKLRGALYGMGWKPDEEERAPRFALRGWRWWKIDSSSPVLSTASVSQEIADAVSGLRYRLSLAALGDELSDFRPADIVGETR